MQDWNSVFNSVTASGVYQVASGQCEEALRELAAAHNLSFKAVDVADVADKESFLRSVARALQFPDYFGANWDAFNDCLTDLSWMRAGGHVLFFTGFGRFAAAAQHDAAVAVRILGVAADFWRRQEVSFYALLAD